MTTPLDEPIPVETPLGRGHAILVNQNNFETYWTVVMSNGALVDFRQPQIRVARNYTDRRGIGDEEMKRIIERPANGKKMDKQGD